MKIGRAPDHGGYEMKQKIHILLNAKGHKVVDFGNLQYDRDDDFAIPLARAVTDRVVERGVLLCGSGIGASLAANKIEGVRAAVCHDDFSARQGVEDDDMNILCLGGLTDRCCRCLELRKKLACSEVQRSGTAPSSYRHVPSVPFGALRASCRKFMCARKAVGEVEVRCN